MAGPVAGLPVAGDDINVTAGDIARQFQAVCNRAVTFKAFLDQYTPQDLVASYDITIEAANTLKSAVGEMDMVAQAHAANSTFMARIRGMGAV